ncbi:MAG TPA: penicillin-binding transpeptidase domain-containing protein, partial [Solirubrobacteraceae bacterium]
MAALDRRIGWLFVLFLGLLGLAVLKAADLGLLQADSLQQVAATQQVTRDVIPASRGVITDRNGVELAISQSADEVVADPYLIKQPQATAEKLAPLLGKPVLTVLALLTKPHDGYVPLARLLPADRATKIMKLQINGISTVPESTRFYPRGWAASQVLGSVHLDGAGASGLEYLYNKQLQGSSGVRRIVNDAIGQPISIDDVRTMEPGATVKLTLDAPLQDEVEQVLAGVGAQYSPKGATAIVMNPNTGAILALANWPRVNANDPGASPAYATDDRAVTFNYEPGSTFKAFTVAGALQDNVVSPGTTL